MHSPREQSPRSNSLRLHIPHARPPLLLEHWLPLERPLTVARIQGELTVAITLHAETWTSYSLHLGLFSNIGNGTLCVCVVCVDVCVCVCAGVVGAQWRRVDPGARGRGVQRRRACGGAGRGGRPLALHRARAGRGPGPLRVPDQHRAQAQPLLQPHRAARGGVVGGGGGGVSVGAGARGRGGHARVRGARAPGAARGARPALDARPTNHRPAERARRGVAVVDAARRARAVAAAAGGAAARGPGAVHLQRGRREGHHPAASRPRAR